MVNMRRKDVIPVPPEKGHFSAEDNGFMPRLELVSGFSSLARGSKLREG